MRFVSLHSHTTFSYQDGYGTPAQHMERVAELGMSAAGFTEHGNVSSHVGAEKYGTKYGVKPIFGLEAYTETEPGSDRKFHLTLLAADAEGYRNLMRICSRSWAEGFHRWPTVSGQMLADHSDGLVVLSGCSDSLLACSLLGGKSIAEEDSSFKRAQRVATNFRALFGDRYYLECQIFPELERTKQINTAYERMSELTGIPLVATADVHTLRPGDSELRALLHAAGRGSNTIAQQLSSWEYDVPDYYPESDEEVTRRLRATGLSKKAARRALHATEEIADRCTVTLPRSTRFKYPVPDPQQALREALRDGWRYRLAQGNGRLVSHRQEYAERVEHELALIYSKGFESYFLLVGDIVAWTKDRGIVVGPGRGSSAASVVCYLLRITEPDPLQFPLTDFSRFIDPTREDLPDIDVDFDDSRRHEVREYAVRKFGEERVANIGTFTKYKGRNSLDDVGRVYQIPHAALQTVKDLVVERSGGDSRADATLEDTFAMFPDAARVLERFPKIRQAIALEGNYRGMSTHAAGLVIADVPITDICAVYTREDKKTGQVLTGVSVNKYDAEYLEMMKIDFLGLTTAGVVGGLLELTGMTVEDLYRIPLDDPETLAAFAAADVFGIFQFEGRATRLVCRDIKPDTFGELVHINALSRPGPLFSGTTTEYTRVKWGMQERPSVHPILDKITEATRGQIIYQEQILRALAQFGGLSVKRVHEIRRIISQKLGEAQFNTSAEDFAANAQKLHGVSRETAMKVWERVVTSASYAFVYSHSLSYTIIGYWTMWFKVHHPTQFYMARLGKSNKENWPRLIRDAERHDVRVRGVTPGVSGLGWTSPEAGVVVAGYEQLEGVGPVTARSIVETDAALTRARGYGLQTADDFLDVKGIGPATLNKMRHQIGTEDPFGIQTVTQRVGKVRAWLPTTSLPSPTHNSSELLDIYGEVTTVYLGMVLARNYQDYAENRRSRTGMAMEDILRGLRRPDLMTSIVLRCLDEQDEDVYIRMDRFKYPQFKRALDGIEVGRDLVLARGKKIKSEFVIGVQVNCNWLVVISPDD